MLSWVILDYVTFGGRNVIREWLDEIPVAAMAAIDNRLLTMSALPRWSEKWVSKYRGTKEIYEFRIPHNKVQYRPLGTYFGPRRYVLLRGAIEKNGRIPTGDIESAEHRITDLRNGLANVQLHQFDGA